MPKRTRYWIQLRLGMKIRDFPDKWEKHWTWEEVYIDARRCVFKALENEFSEGFC